ncbi:polyketide cyclase [Pontibacter korlensis]|uniref:polyketide cyclase n=1 Tax=Pontibacter korlensis TaxID=400092 RepID=UPI00061ADFEE|nr:polyketide cyclase [Pontibacter korlensis]
MKKEFILSAFITLAFLSLGFLLLHYELVGYGVSFFVFLPFSLGYLLGRSTFRKLSLYGLVFSLVIFLLLLLIGELEGMICLLMAIPLIFLAIAFGAYFAHLNRRSNNIKKEDDLLKSSIAPFLLFIVLGFSEKQLVNDQRQVLKVSSEITLPYTPLQVYDAIKHVDTLDAEKPFLMKLDLPVPQKCVVSEEKVGGLRTCYFERGQIIERITELEKGRILRMNVIDYQLTGRSWLGFEEASYTFEELKNGGCRMIRTTTYTSVLYPRFYWQPLEKIGIEQEHEYVFNNLVKDLNTKYGR